MILPSAYLIRSSSTSELMNILSLVDCLCVSSSSLRVSANLYMTRQDISYSFTAFDKHFLNVAKMKFRYLADKFKDLIDQRYLVLLNPYSTEIFL